MIGKTSPIDVLSVFQGDKRYYSLLSVTWSLVADIDVESEKYRWMGGFRFTFTAVNKILATTKPVTGTLTYLEEEVKNKSFCVPRECQTCQKSLNTLPMNDTSSGPPTPLLNNVEAYLRRANTVEGKFSFFLACNLRQLSGDTQGAPRAHLADGYIDLIFVRNEISKTKLTKLLLDLETGKYVDAREVEYHKVKAFTLTPGKDSKVVMLDGERIPPEQVKVEVHPAFCRIFI